MELRPGSTSGAKLHHGRFFLYSPVKSGAPLGWRRVTLVSAAVATVTLLIVKRLERAFLLVEDIYRHKSDDILKMITHEAKSAIWPLTQRNAAT